MSSYYVAYTVIAEAGLSFIGMGAQPPTPSLGQMIAAGRDFLYVDSWMAIVPAIPSRWSASMSMGNTMWNSSHSVTVRRTPADARATPHSPTVGSPPR